MAPSSMSKLVRHLRSAALLGKEPTLTDGQLLDDFIHHRREEALEVLVRRHAPMVWGVCRRVLGNHHDAEDAFQATFLVLVRKAASIYPRSKVVNWLYGVARQTALAARSLRAKREVHERNAPAMPQPAIHQHDFWNDLQAVLDQELSRLPEKYRTVIVLCDLEGKTKKEVAQQLHLPEGTVASRIATARTMLGKRLRRAQPNLALPAGALTALVAQHASAAAVPRSLIDETIKAANLLAAGQNAVGTISPTAATLSEGIVKAMLLQKCKALGSLLFAVLVSTCLMTGMSQPKFAVARSTESAGLYNVAWGWVAADTQGGQEGAPKHLPPEIVKKWREAGAEVGWLQTSELGMPSFMGLGKTMDSFGRPVELVPGALPAFQFQQNAVGDTSKLPDPGMPFGVVMIAPADTQVKHVAGLKSLQSLIITGDELSNGTLKELAPLKNLQWLVIFVGQETKITEEGLKELTALKSLQTLYITGGTVSDQGLKEVAKLTSLRSLFLVAFGENNVVTEAGFKELAKLKDLQQLSLLGHKEFTDAELKVLAGLKSLQALNLFHSMGLTDAGLKSLSGLTGLKLLGLAGTKVTDAGLKELAAFKNLRSLFLYDTEVTDQGLKQLAGLKLNTLEIPDKAKTDIGLKNYVAAVAAPTTLSLKGGQVTDAGLKELAGLKTLQSLDLRDTQITDAGLKELAGLTSLRSLELTNVKISDAGLKELAGLKSLQTLDLASTQVTDTGLKVLSGLKSLRNLNLGSNQITGAGLKELAGVTSLHTLNLKNTQVSDKGLMELAGMKSLQSLELEQTQITDAGLKVLGGLKTLLNLNLSENQITDAGLKALAGLNSLHTLNLKNTQISDNGLKVLAGMKSLHNLNLLQTQATEAGVTELRQALPSTRIEFSVPD